jgi:hypothetical protein
LVRAVATGSTCGWFSVFTSVVGILMRAPSLHQIGVPGPGDQNGATA